MTVFLRDPDVTLHHGDALNVLRSLPDAAADATVTSPPYLDARPEYPSPSLDEFHLIFRELRRVAPGALALNVGRIWRDGRELLWWMDLLDLARQAGWPLADTLVWVKPNANPIHGRVLADSHEYVFLLGDAFDPDAIRTEYARESVARMNRKWVNGRGVKGDNRESQDGRDLHPQGARARSFISLTVGVEKGNKHPAPMPLALAEHLVKLTGASIILDPFAGSGTTLWAARKHGRRSIGIDLNESYCQLAADRLAQQSLLAQEATA